MSIPNEIKNLIEGWSKNNTERVVKKIAKALRKSDDPYQLITAIISYANYESANPRRYNSYGALAILTSGEMRMSSPTEEFKALNRALTKLQKKYAVPASNNSNKKPLSTAVSQNSNDSNVFFKSFIFLMGLGRILASVTSQNSNQTSTTNSDFLGPWLNYPNTQNKTFMETALNNYAVAKEKNLFAEFVAHTTELALKIVNSQKDDITPETEEPNLFLATAEFETRDYKQAKIYATKAFKANRAVPALRLRQYINYLQDSTNTPENIEIISQDPSATAEYLYKFHKNQYFNSHRIIKNAEVHPFEKMLLTGKEDYEAFNQLLTNPALTQQDFYKLKSQLNDKDPANNIIINAYKKKQIIADAVDHPIPTNRLINLVVLNPTDMWPINQILNSEAFNYNAKQLMHRHKIMLEFRAEFYFQRSSKLDEAIEHYEKFLAAEYNLLAEETFIDQKFYDLLENPLINRQSIPGNLRDKIDQIKQMENYYYNHPLRLFWWAVAYTFHRINEVLIDPTTPPVAVGVTLIVGVLSILLSTLKQKVTTEWQIKSLAQKNKSLYNSLLQQEFKFEGSLIVNLTSSNDPKTAIGFESTDNFDNATNKKIKKLIQSKISELSSKLTHIEVPAASTLTGYSFSCKTEAEFISLKQNIQTDFIDAIKSSLTTIIIEFRQNHLKNIQDKLQQKINHLNGLKTHLSHLSGEISRNLDKEIDKHVHEISALVSSLAALYPITSFVADYKTNETNLNTYMDAIDKVIATINKSIEKPIKTSTELEKRLPPPKKERKHVWHNTVKPKNEANAQNQNNNALVQAQPEPNRFKFGTLKRQLKDKSHLTKPLALFKAIDLLLPEDLELDAIITNPILFHNICGLLMTGFIHLHQVGVKEKSFRNKVLSLEMCHEIKNLIYHQRYLIEDPSLLNPLFYLALRILQELESLNDYGSILNSAEKLPIDEIIAEAIESKNNIKKYVKNNANFFLENLIYNLQSLKRFYQDIDIILKTSEHLKPELDLGTKEALKYLMASISSNIHALNSSTQKKIETKLKELCKTPDIFDRFRNPTRHPEDPSYPDIDVITNLLPLIELVCKNDETFEQLLKFFESLKVIIMPANEEKNNDNNQAASDAVVISPETSAYASLYAPYAAEEVIDGTTFYTYYPAYVAPTPIDSNLNVTNQAPRTPSPEL